MKWKIIKEIVEKLQKGLSCPNCEGALDADSFELIRIEDDQIEVRSTCGACKSVAGIVGKIGNNKPSNVSSELSVDTVIGVHEKLKHLDTSDITDLFKPE